MRSRNYLAIDLKSFYASVECVERGLNPMITNLVVADKRRTEKTICLAVSPSLKTYGIPGRPRLFEVIQRVKEVNIQRQNKAPNQTFSGSSWDEPTLKSDPGLSVDYIVAPPRMALYMDYSTRIFNVYLKYVAPEDIHPYSIDEVFMDVISKDTNADYNSNRFKLQAGIHPNKQMQKLWNKHGEECFEYSVLKILEYDDPQKDQTDKLIALRDECMENDPQALLIWK